MTHAHDGLAEHVLQCAPVEDREKGSQRLGENAGKMASRSEWTGRVFHLEAGHQVHVGFGLGHQRAEPDIGWRPLEPDTARPSADRRDVTQLHQATHDLEDDVVGEPRLTRKLRNRWRVARGARQLHQAAQALVRKPGQVHGSEQ